MLPHRIILALFAALLSQGNIASALPQGNFQTRGEGVGGQDTYDAIEARNGSSDIEVRGERSIDTLDNGLMVKRAPLRIAQTIKDVARGSMPRDLHAYSTWISDLWTAISDTGLVFVGIPATILGVAYWLIPSGWKSHALAWAIHLCKEIVRYAGELKRGRQPPRTINVQPTASDEAAGRRANEQIEAWGESMGSHALQTIGVVVPHEASAQNTPEAEQQQGGNNGEGQS